MNKAEQILSGECGLAVKGLALSALNWQLAGMLTRHPSIKAPTNRGGIEDTRDEVKLPELEHQSDGIKLDQLTSWLVASYLLTEEVRRTTDVDMMGRSFRPFEYLKPKTPSMAIREHFAWRAKQQGQELAAKATLLKMGNAGQIAERAAKVAEGQQAEKLAYALEEVASVTNANLRDWPSEELIGLLLDCPLDIVEITKTAAENAVNRAKARIEQGLWSSLDEEVILFTQQ
jgi:hypothetical protein